MIVALGYDSRRIVILTEREVRAQQLYEAAWRVGRLDRVYSLQVVSLVKGFRKWSTVARHRVVLPHSWDIHIPTTSRT
jgi:hypothetical protein